MSDVKRGGKRKGVYLVVIDSSEECMTALDYAADFANAEQGYVALLNVYEQAFLQNWKTVEERVRQELRQQAEQTLWDASARVIEKTGKIPMLCIEEGTRSEVIVEVIKQNKNIVSLVLGAAVGSKAGPLVNYFSSKGLSSLPVPLMIVPGHLGDNA